jgi:hypothetical protein
MKTMLVMATRAAGQDLVLSFFLPPAPLCISPVRPLECFTEGKLAVAVILDCA